MHDEAELFHRYPGNPILSAQDFPYPMNSVFNPGAAVHDGDTVLLTRVEDRRGISHLTVARSADGRKDWRVEPKPLISDDPTDPTICWGAEDARISHVPQLDAYAITYTAYGPAGPCVALALTKDFRTVEQRGVIMPPEDKNACLLPRTINGQYVLFHRPVAQHGARADVWLSRSADLKSWTASEPVVQSRSGPWWDATRIGMGPTPLETPHGWLAIYHGVKKMVATDIYRVGLMLLDLEDPTKVLRRTTSWVLGPDAPYERIGDVPNVVFPTGLVHDEDADELRLYYGAADSTIAMAAGKYSELLDYVLSQPEQI
jgi:predicted GH43/DUF377 family glycosyl hydrolase